MTNTAWLQRLISIEGQDASYRPEKALVLDMAKDSMLWDVEGNSYIDLCAGFGALPLGHNNEDVYARVRAAENNDAIVHGLGDLFPSQVKIELMETLLSLLPPYLNQVLLAVTGSQAVELAMKTAMLASQGSGFIAFHGAYHGVDLGALALSGQEKFRTPFDSWLNRDHVQHLPFRCDVSVLHQAFERFREQGVRPAAIIVEPIQCRGGFHAATIEWLKTLRALCDQEGCFLIFDEVFTGLGRAGSLSFADRVACDLLCLGKALGGGMPLSACVGAEKLMKAWPLNEGEAIHTGTFFGHPYSCRVGLATLQTLVEKNLSERAMKLGECIQAELRESLSASKRVREVRGSGLMIAVEFAKASDAIFVMKELQEEGVIVIPCGTQGECVSFSPALNIDEKLFKKAVATFVAIVDRMEMRA